MIFHRLEKVCNGDKVEYAVHLIKRKYFMEKKIAKVMEGIEDPVQGQIFVDILQNGFQNGVKAAELKMKQSIKL